MFYETLALSLLEKCDMQVNTENCERVFTLEKAELIYDVALPALKRWAPLYTFAEAFPDRVADHPILNCNICFDAFASEFNVGRKIKSSKDAKGNKTSSQKSRQAIREACRAKADKLSEPGDLDSLIGRFEDEEELNMLTYDPPVSLISKIAHFVHPASVLPYDRFSDAGIKQLMTTKGVSKSEVVRLKIDKDPVSLSAYAKLWVKLLPEIEKKLGPPKPCGGLSGKVLQARMLDHFLMAAGGRFDKNLLGLIREPRSRPSLASLHPKSSQCPVRNR